VTVDPGVGFLSWRWQSARLIAGTAVDLRELPDHLVVYLADERNAA
jgi:hypothetical protein